MRSWPAPQVPRLPGRGPALHLFDTAAGLVRATAPGPVAGLYVCGITPYDATHLGHAATYVAFDLVHRAWLDAGHEVHYVQNVTDVDDPLLERAQRDGVDWAELAEQETALFREDMAALGVLPPRDYVGAVEAIPRIAQAVARLREAGAAYELEGDTYFAVSADPAFGAVGGLDVATMVALSAERGGDPGRLGKKDPLDAMLWMAARPGEPSWEAPQGTGLPPGRPGWHIECSVIALEHLGMPLDVQGGGSDLVFPHHELSASHAVVLEGRAPFAQHYVHAGMVGLDGEKMSKSRGNLVFVSALRRQGVPPAAIRLALLSHHYRGDWEWTRADLDRALERLALWTDAVSRPDGPPADGVLAAVRERLADDLDAPRALEVVDAWARAQRETGGDDTGAPGVVSRLVDALLGVRL
ncbi:cysteine--1-D-myo-inosityl 2-amino-2-deoxy-alpha-D-glucopyranoside ligase [Vallicoccus soli]|uniref:L-cysteine:1D-myo-inositol 2-amino-2-deoxy-alpha-D-glucopyranoside ligase n=1 Tax=Vallicoccus soli TaxID=2339232 RepID=A0A3A3YRB3_9ACTN|nr:cysteine--1-D-myo-inosityl 2-amino-2-deoxy-alpha-D-glucopyranoside ligase [Vallicoccus soli]RJK93855.1 cysteine--1-D-myo-inosityl 2-amino-2-deoxy-alpha-D-glucopyranoside ligase [Vallicoccus soli]